MLPKIFDAFQYLSAILPHKNRHGQKGTYRLDTSKNSRFGFPSLQCHISKYTKVIKIPTKTHYNGKTMQKYKKLQ